MINKIVNISNIILTRDMARYLLDLFIPYEQIQWVPSQIYESYGIAAQSSIWIQLARGQSQIPPATGGCGGLANHSFQ